MGRITEDFTRLVGEIQGGHRDRQQMMRDLGRNGAEMQAGFHAARAEMSRRQKNALRDFATGIENKVSGLLKGFAGDLAGARRAWRGTTAGRAIFKRAAKPGAAEKGLKEGFST
jgi:hypothetical protein